MCGVPYHAAENYIARLIQKGYRVAICDQMEVAGPGKKLVRREVTRIVTPGTAMNAACCARMRITTWRRVLAERQIAPASLMSMSPPANSAPPKSTPAEVHRRARNAERRAKSWRPPARLHRNVCACLKTDVEPWVFGADYAARSLREHFHLLSLDGCGLDATPAGHRRGRRDSALPARHPARRARSSGRAHVLRSRRRAGAGRHHRSQSGTGRAAVRRRIQGRHAAQRAGPHAHRHGRAPAAPPPAAPFARPRGNRSAPGCGRGTARSRPFCAPELAKDLARILDLERLLAKITLGTAGPRDLLALAPLARASFPAEARMPTAIGRALRDILRTPRRNSPKCATAILDAHCRRAAGESDRRRHDPRRLRSAPRRTARLSPEQPDLSRRRSKQRERDAHRHSHRSRSASTMSSATTSRFPKPTCTWRRPITSASKRWSTPNASPRPN